MEYVKQIIQDILTMLYQYLGISIICSVLIILVWKQAEENSWKSVWVRLKTLLQNHRWRKRFFFVLYIVFVLQRTIFNRGPWGNPLGNVVGNWWFIQNGSPNCDPAIYLRKYRAKSFMTVMAISKENPPRVQGGSFFIFA